MLIIQDTNRNPEVTKLKMKSLKVRDSVDLLVTLGLKVIQPGPAVEVTIVLTDCDALKDKSISIKIDDLLPSEQFPEFAIDSRCFEEGMRSENFQGFWSDVYLRGLAIAVSANMEVLIDRSTGVRGRARMYIILGAFKTSVEFSLQTTSHLFE